MAAITLSTDPESKDNYGPYIPNIGATSPSTGKSIRYNNVDDIEEVLNAHGKETAAFIIEPIQGEAGVMVPDEDYLARVQELCKKHNVLLIADEIQTGIGRTGKMLCSEWAGIKPDMVTLGKAISGGMYPVSAVLASREVMMVVEPGTHGSTYGGNPLGCAVSIRALELIEEEKMIENAQRLGEIFRQSLIDLKSPILKIVRGKGLLNACVIDESATNGRSAWDLCILLKEKGLLVCIPIKYDWGDSGQKKLINSQAKPTHGDIIRFAPPMVITEEELRKGLSIIAEALKELPNAPQADH